MTDQVIPDFIVIDDDPTNNLICQRYLKMIFPLAEVKTFTNPFSGLEYIHEKYENPEANKAFLFLDINMPVLNGWGVLEKFLHFPDAIKEHFTISLLSSSLAIQDKQLATAHPLVSSYIEKPLSMPQLKTIFPNIQA